MKTTKDTYPAKLTIDYPGQMDRTSTFFRIIWSIPIFVLLMVLTSSGSFHYINEAGKSMSSSGADITMGLFVATALMIVVRQRYPRWWFDFALELQRFSARVGAYIFLLSDQYPSTVETQSVHLDVTYPDVKNDLNQWLPLVKWLLAIPHYVVLAFLGLGAIGATVIAWFSILFTGQYPRGLFDYVVGVGRWSLRVNAYAFLLTTDQYPPFTLD